MNLETPGDSGLWATRPRLLVLGTGGLHSVDELAAEPEHRRPRGWVY